MRSPSRELRRRSHNALASLPVAAGLAAPIRFLSDGPEGLPDRAFAFNLAVPALSRFFEYERQTDALAHGAP